MRPWPAAHTGIAPPQSNQHAGPLPPALTFEEPQLSLALPRCTPTCTTQHPMIIPANRPVRFRSPHDALDHGAAHDRAIDEGVRRSRMALDPEGLHVRQELFEFRVVSRPPHGRASDFWRLGPSERTSIGVTADNGIPRLGRLP